MDPNTHKNFMGAAGAGGSSPSGQVMLQGYFDSNPVGTVENSWEVPEGVTSICAVAVGAGECGKRSNSDADGGAGADLRYVNDIPVTPGETLTLGAAKGFIGDASEMDSGDSNSGYASYLRRGSTNLVYAEGGRTWNNANAPTVGTGYDGGPFLNGSSLSHPKAGGGGDAAKYTSNGTYGTARNHLGICGKGTGITGDNESSRHGGAPNGWDNNRSNNWRGCYGAGGGGMDSGASDTRGSSGAPGAVRVIWGEGRSYPSNAKGVFPTPPAGSELDIRWHIPVPYNNEPSSHSSDNQLYHIQVIDDTGTNLVASSGQGAQYDGLTYYASGDLNQSSLPKRDFDDITAPGFTYNGSVVVNQTALERFFDTDHDGSYNLKTLYSGASSLHGNASNRTDTDEYLTGANHNDNCFTNQWLIKFDSNKVIKKIHFYGGKDVSWVPRCRIFLDGNLIADDAAHYIEPDTDEGHSANHTARRLAVFEFT